MYDYCFRGFYVQWPWNNASKLRLLLRTLVMAVELELWMILLNDIMLLHCNVLLYSILAYTSVKWLFLIDRSAQSALHAIATIPGIIF